MTRTLGSWLGVIVLLLGGVMFAGALPACGPCEGFRSEERYVEGCGCVALPDVNAVTHYGCRTGSGSLPDAAPWKSPDRSSPDAAGSDAADDADAATTDGAADDGAADDGAAGDGAACDGAADDGAAGDGDAGLIALPLPPVR